MERTKLINVRLHKHWTQKQAADFAGVGERTYRAWEKGEITPRLPNIQQLCEIFEVTAEELGLHAVQEEPAPIRDAPRLTSFFAGDLSMQLLTAVFSSRGNAMDVQAQISATLEKFDAMHIDVITRRQALHRLASLAVVPFATNTTLFDETLNSYAASLVACQELGHGKEASDLVLAFEGATATLQRLQPIIQASARYRKPAIALACQAARLQQVLAGHLEGPEASIKYARQAVFYGKESGNIQEHVMALDSLAWSYASLPQYGLYALQAMEEAAVLLREHRKSVPLYLHGQIYSTLAVMQAQNGQPSNEASRLAAKLSFADQGYTLFVDDPGYTLTINEAETRMHHGDYREALDALSQLIDPTSLQAKRSLSERGHLRALSDMMMVSLKDTKKDLERETFLWQQVMQKSRTLKSERRFNDTVLAYHLMEARHPGESQVQSLRPRLAHW